MYKFISLNYDKVKVSYKNSRIYTPRTPGMLSSHPSFSITLFTKALFNINDNQMNG